MVIHLNFIYLFISNLFIHKNDFCFQITGIYEDNDVKVKVVPRVDKDDKNDKNTSGNLVKRKRTVGENTIKIFNRGHLELDMKLLNLVNVILSISSLKKKKNFFF